MPAKSKAQQRFMGMVHATQKGDMETPSPEVSKAADSMSDKDAKDFASTSHKGLPDKIKEIVLSELRSVRAIQMDYTDVINSIQKHLDAYKKFKGTPEESEHVQQLKSLSIQKKKLTDELDAKVKGLYKDAELKVDELTGTDAAGPYNTPFAFTNKGGEAKKGKRQADLTGYSVVGESFTKGVTYGGTACNGGCYMGKEGLKKIIKISKESPNNVFMFRQDNTSGLQPHFIKNGVIGKATTLNPSYDLDRNKVRNLNIGKDAILAVRLYEVMNENRWLALKQEDSSAQSKIGRGISNINKQLAEMERLLNWYGKIKNESGVDNKSYWKRTNTNIYSIKERLIKLDQKIRQISQ
jgi:hypothetical protein